MSKNPNFDPNKHFDDNNPESTFIWDQKDIHNKTSKFIQNIYNKDNKVKISKYDIKKFLYMDDTAAPWEALEDRKLPRELAESYTWWIDLVSLSAYEPII